MRLPSIDWRLLLVALALAACMTGPAVEGYAPALGPAGAKIDIRVRSGNIRGELLETRDSGVVVMSPEEIVLVPFATIRGITLPRQRFPYMGPRPWPAVRERLRLLSRFPTGLAPEQLARLLQARGQQTIRTYQPAAAGHALHGATGVRSDSIAEAAFLASARAGTARYRDLAAARTDGYRPLGGELPSLGEHWVHNRRALADTLDPAAPSILVYVRVGGQPVLAGVAYTRLLAPSARLPEFPRSQPQAWHEHNGGVESEVLPLAHHAAQPSASGDSRLRIAVMHAWVWVANPAGVWEAENWALPYVRLSLAPDAGSGGLEARALSVVTAADYYLQAIVSTGALDANEAKRVEGILADVASRAADRAADSPTTRPVGGAMWTSMWSEIEAAVRPEAGARLAPLRAALSGAVP